MIKKLLVVSLAALGICLTGCLTDPTSTGPTISLGKIDTLVANSGIAKVVTGTITADEALVGSPSIEIVNSSGTVILAAVISRSLVEANPNTKSDKITVTLQALTGAVTGNYTLKITANSGTSATTNFDFYVKGAVVPVGTPVVTTTLTAGANKSASGSSIDLDGGIVWTMAAAATNLAKIDLCYAHAASGDDKLGTPVWAQASGYDFAAAWVTPPVTKFYKSTLTAAGFDAITTKEEIPAFVDASAVASSAAVTNDVFIVKTTEGAVVLVKVSAQVPGEAGTITIKSAK